MTTIIHNNLTKLRDLLKLQRNNLDIKEASRGALLMRGRLFTWLATTQTALKQQNRKPLTHISAFWAIDAEPDLEPLLRQLSNDHGYTVSLPVITGKDEPLQFKIWKPDSVMEKGAYGILQPRGDIAPNPDIMLVPTLGFTREGHRIGYGGGFYDRTIAQIRQNSDKCITIGIAWACNDLNDPAYSSLLPYRPQSHDQTLDAIITDMGWAKPAPQI